MGRRPAAPVLIVEDNHDTAAAIARLLAMQGFEPAVAGDGLDALAYLRAGHDARVIVLDIRMPNMDGVAFRRALSEDPRWADIPIVVFTAYRTRDIDAFEIISKSDPDGLLDAVARAAVATRH